MRGCVAGAGDVRADVGSERSVVWNERGLQEAVQGVTRTALEACKVSCENRLPWRGHVELLDKFASLWEETWPGGRPRVLGLAHRVLVHYLRPSGFGVGGGRSFLSINDLLGVVRVVRGSPFANALLVLWHVYRLDDECSPEENVSCDRLLHPFLRWMLHKRDELHVLQWNAHEARVKRRQAESWHPPSRYASEADRACEAVDEQPLRGFSEAKARTVLRSVAKELGELHRPKHHPSWHRECLKASIIESEKAVEEWEAWEE